MGGFDDVGRDALDAVVLFQYVHAAARNHRIAHFQLGKVQYFFQPGQCLGVKTSCSCAWRSRVNTSSAESGSPASRGD